VFCIDLPGQEDKNKQGDVVLAHVRTWVEPGITKSLPAKAYNDFEFTYPGSEYRLSLIRAG
jgi:hypothetical protein